MIEGQEPPRAGPRAIQYFDGRRGPLRGDHPGDDVRAGWAGGGKPDPAAGARISLSIVLESSCGGAVLDRPVCPERCRRGRSAGSPAGEPVHLVEKVLARTAVGDEIASGFTGRLLRIPLHIPRALSRRRTGDKPHRPPPQCERRCFHRPGSDFDMQIAYLDATGTTGHDLALIDVDRRGRLRWAIDSPKPLRRAGGRDAEGRFGPPT